MKKKRFASLLIVAPLALLAACSSTPSLVLEANWFNNTGTKNIPDDFEETLEYAVSFEKSSADSAFSMELPNGGTYKTTFKSGDAEGKKTYVYETELSVTVQYKLGGSIKESTDTVTTQVVFLDVQNELKPLSSTRVAHVTAPLYTPSNPPAALDQAYEQYDYKIEIVYDHENDKATFTRTDLSSDEAAANPKTEEIKLSGSGSYFDNEQLVPVLRAAQLSSSMVFRSIDPTTRTCEKMAIKDGPTAVTLKQSIKFNGNEEAEEKEFNANEISIGYNKKNSGGAQKFTIAQQGTRDSNTNRNVVLKYEYPVINSHGTMTFRLISANFYNA